MKTKVLSLFTVLLIAFSFSENKVDGSSGTGPDSNCTSIEQSAPMDQGVTSKKYQIKSGIITFETTIAGKKGKEILYFDDYGAKELIEKYSNDQLKEAKLADGSTMYTIKYDQKTAYKMGDASRGAAYKFDWNEISASSQGTKAKKLENVTIAGKDCESYSYESSGMMTVFAGWKNICLLTEQKMKVGSSVTKAVKIEENVVIAPEKFRVPAGFAIK